MIVALAGSVLALLGLFIIDAMAEPEPFPEFELEDGVDVSRVSLADAMMGGGSGRVLLRDLVHTLPPHLWIPSTWLCPMTDYLFPTQK